MKNVNPQRQSSLLSVDEVTECLGVSRSTIDRLRKKGKLSPVSWKGRLWFNPEDIDEFVREEGLSGVLRQIDQSDGVYETTGPEVSGSIV